MRWLASGLQVAYEIRAETGVGLEARLQSALAGLTAVQQAIGSRAGRWVATQVDRLDLPVTDLSLNIGSGSRCIDGWVNIDAWPAPLAMDLRWGLPFEDERAARVYMSHVLEHMYYPNEAVALLREVRRILRPGGRIRLIVPDIEASIAAYASGDRRFFEGRRDLWPHWKINTRLESFLGFAGAGPHPGMFGDAHKWGYDFETAAHLLRQTGFRDVQRSTFQGSHDPVLRIDETSHWAGGNVDGRYYSLFIEAIR